MWQKLEGYFCKPSLLEFCLKLAVGLFIKHTKDIWKIGMYFLAKRGPLVNIKCLNQMSVRIAAPLPYQFAGLVQVDDSPALVLQT